MVYVSSITPRPFQPWLQTIPVSTPDHSSLDSRPFQPQLQTISASTPDHFSLNSKPFQPWLQTIPASTPNHSSLDSRPFQPQLQTIPASTLNHSNLDSRPFQPQLQTIPILTCGLGLRPWYNLFGLCATELDACVEPVLSMEEAIQHPHNVCVSILESCSSSRRTVLYFLLSLHL